MVVDGVLQLYLLQRFDVGNNLLGVSNKEREYVGGGRFGCRCRSGTCPVSHAPRAVHGPMLFASWWMLIDDDDHGAGRDAKRCAQSYARSRAAATAQPCDGGKASAEGFRSTRCRANGRIKGAAEMEIGEEQRDWAVDKVKEYNGSCMVRNGRRVSD